MPSIWNMLLPDITCPPPVVGQPTTIYGVAIILTLFIYFGRILTSILNYLLFISRRGKNLSVVSF